MSENMQSETIGALAEALAKAQGKIKGATKDAENPYFKSKYADLASVWDACRDALSSHGLSVIQTTDDAPEGVTVVTTLAHSSGEWIRGRMTLKPVKSDPQGVGSATTYARRYALAAIVGVAPEDDDGAAASGTTVRAPKETFAVTEEKRDGWKGPLKVTNLKNKLRDLADAVKSCSDPDELGGIEIDHKEILEQAEHDLPDWYAGAVKAIRDRAKTLMMNPLQAA